MPSRFKFQLETLLIYFVCYLPKTVKMEMDVFFESEGLWHIPEFIFGLLSYQDVKHCCQVSTKWKLFLTRQHGMFEKEEEINEDLNFVLTKKVFNDLPEYDYDMVKRSRYIKNIDDVSKTIIEHYPDFQIVMDHFQNQRYLSAFKAFLLEFKTMILESEDKFYVHPVQKAIEENRANMVKFLIESPADLTKMKIKDKKYIVTESENVINALHLACSHGHLDVIKVLLENIQRTKIDINQKDPSGGTILHTLITRYCHKDNNTAEAQKCFKYLLENAKAYGIDLNATDSCGRTPFHTSCLSNNIGLIELWFDTTFEFTPASFRLGGDPIQMYNSPALNLALDLYNSEKNSGRDVSKVDKIFRKEGRLDLDDVCIDVCCLLLQERKQRYLMSKK